MSLKLALSEYVAGVLATRYTSSHIVVMNTEDDMGRYYVRFELVHPYGIRAEGSYSSHSQEPWHMIGDKVLDMVAYQFAESHEPEPPQFLTELLYRPPENWSEGDDYYPEKLT